MMEDDPDLPPTDLALHDLARRSHSFARLDNLLFSFLVINLLLKGRKRWLMRCEGKIPDDGLPVQFIREFINALAGLDSNNQIAVVHDKRTNKFYVKRIVGAGEREGRVVSALVSELHMGLCHGIGRSGNLIERQPKALGSSMFGNLANSLALDAIRHIGIRKVTAALVVPMCTGMTLALCLGSWRRWKPNAKYVVFLRVDQKSGFKAIFFPGLEPIVVDNIFDGDSLVTDVKTLRDILKERSEEILAVLSTTSCFAPRAPDNLHAIGDLCREFGVRHLVNNAYGLQSHRCRSLIAEATTSIYTQFFELAGMAGKIDAFVQSLDKNFLVPVGGSIVASFDKLILDGVAEFYPGRASIVPSRDLTITLLELGKNGLYKLYDMQAQHYLVLRSKMAAFAESIKQRLLDVPANTISLAMTLNGFKPAEQALFGSMLFARGVTGARTICMGNKKKINGFEFNNYGSHSSVNRDGYVNVACAIGKFKNILSIT
uniref:O-phosphoseryl-tRNA(Sec) selenium transferase n=1 Tax=Syphacia muris TaxID=451379 RepID=A0A0N5AP70_9BILA